VYSTYVPLEDGQRPKQIAVVTVKTRGTIVAKRDTIIRQDRLYWYTEIDLNEHSYKVKTQKKAKS
jgi:hypothetical protein